MSVSGALTSDTKFAILAIVNVRAHFGATPFNLADGTEVFGGLPVDLPSLWQGWIGSVQADRLRSCNVALIRRTNAGQIEIADETSHEIENHVCGLFTMLRLLGTIEYEEAYSVVGYVRNHELNIQKLTNLDRVHITRGCTPWTVRQEDLGQATKLLASRMSSTDIPQNARFRRGLNSLVEALQHYYGADRLHGFVRAIEALILPDRGSTRKQFVSRCTLCASQPQNATPARHALAEAYDMRSDVEHMHAWDRSLSSYAASVREHVALQRTRQMEALACSMYTRVLLDPILQAHFGDDDHIRAFWSQSSEEIRTTWGTTCDIAAMPLVTRYDGFGRAMAASNTSP